MTATEPDLNEPPSGSGKYFHYFKGKNLPRVTYRKFARGIAACTDAATRSAYIDAFCQSIADLKLEDDWKKMKLFLPEYARIGLSENEIRKVEDTLAQKRKRRNERMLEVYPHCSDEFSTRIDFLDAIFGSQQYGLVGPTTKIFTIGSCFALNIAEYLQKRNFIVSHFGQAEDLNSPFSNAKMLAICASPPPLRQAYIEHWIKLLYRDTPDINFEEAVKNEMQRLEKLAKSLKEAEFLIVTFGNVLDYFMTADAAAHKFEIGPAVAPKFLTITYVEEIHLRANLTHKLKEAGSEFRLGTYPEVMEALNALYSALRNINPHAPLLFTLSPVPIGNAIGIDHARKLGAIEIDCISKSLLRAALDNLMESKKSDANLFYFPSFEIVRWVGPCIDAAVLGREDASSRHVSDHVINGVYEYFIHKFGNVEVLNQKPPTPAKETAGLLQQASRIGTLIKHTHAKTLLDYGGGKSMLYRATSITAGNTVYPSIKAFWGVEGITLYDPAYWPGDLLQEKFDGVICTDVLEHCPQEDIPRMLAELFTYADQFVFVHITNYANGGNAPFTLQSPVWWKEAIERAAKASPQVQYQCVISEVAPDNGSDAIRKESIIERIFRR